MESITNRLRFDYLAVLHGSHVFSIKLLNLGFQKFSYLSKYVKVFENFLFYDFDLKCETVCNTYSGLTLTLTQTPILNMHTMHI